MGILSRYQRKPWTKFVNNYNKKYMSNESLDFVDRLLRYDHNKRLTPREAMAHSYFKPIREYHQQKKANDEKEQSNDNDIEPSNNAENHSSVSVKKGDNENNNKSTVSDVVMKGNE